jgi:general secretion pathway protein M
MKQYLEPLNLWFHSLPQRDKILVVATSVIMIITLFYLIIWEPVYKGLEQQKQQYQSQQSIVSWMQEASAEVKTLKRSGAKTITSSNQPVSLIIEQSAKISGLKGSLGKLESSGKEGARVKLDTASFDQMLIWLNSLEKQHGVTVTSASIERAENTGTVNARLSFSRS